MNPSRVVGWDASWSWHNADGLAFLEGQSLVGTARTRGEETLRRILEFEPGYLAIDAPLVVPNETGGRPVDRLVGKRFHRWKIACYPGNRTRMAKVLEQVAELRRAGYRATSRPDPAGGIGEVYPHLSIVRLFGLDERIPYKKGPVARKRVEFGRLQGHLRAWLGREGFTPAGEVGELLRQPWSKAVEDQVDAILCALTGWNHLEYDGRRSEVIGDEEGGFIVFPGIDRG